MSGQISPPARRLARRAPLSLFAAVSAAATLAGCGASAPSAKDQIGAIMKEEGTRPASLCHHLTSDLLVRFGGLSNCLSRAASASRDPSTRATQVIVHGSGATAVVTDSTGTRSITLVRQKGSWLISGVH